MAIEVLGIDLGKTTCSVVGMDDKGGVVLRRRVRGHRLLSFLSGLPPCTVAMEACGGAHHVARFCQAIGHEPRLMSPLYVRPYVKVHKTDDRDAEGEPFPTLVESLQETKRERECFLWCVGVGGPTGHLVLWGPPL